MVNEKYILFLDQGNEFYSCSAGGSLGCQGAICYCEDDGWVHITERLKLKLNFLDKYVVKHKYTKKLCCMLQES